MLGALTVILEIQELDMKMIQLMLLKRERQKELDRIKANQSTLSERISEKEADVLDLKKTVRLIEGEHQEILAKIKKLESQQITIKKVDEYNALTHELSSADRERVAKELRLSDLYDKLAVEEDLLKTLQESLKGTDANAKEMEREIQESIRQINQEGQALKTTRDQLVEEADPDIFKIYERLLRNKKDRVVVSLENRCCSGCHVMLTPQHENLVRRGERLIFCEHCSRIHYWQESKPVEDTTVATKPRRRRSSTKV